MRKSIVASLLAAASLLDLVAAQDNDTRSSEDRCQGGNDDSWFPNATFNATGSLSVPGFRVNDTYPESTWTWSRYVINGEKSGNRTAISQTLTLKTDPIQNLTDASSLPYTGCVFVFNSLGSSAYKNKITTENGTCNSILTPACRAHILSTAITGASRVSNRASGSSASFSCPSLFSGSLGGDDSPCKDIDTSSFSQRFLPNNFTDGRNTREPGCPLLNVGNSTLEDEPFFSWQGDSTQSGNFTLYDRALLNALPVLTVAWLKATSNESLLGVVQGEADVGWTSANLMCIGANETQPGSRNFTQAERASGAERMVVGWSMMSMLVMSLVFGLL
ncbi:hypothetical protein VTL71DRAFT_5476 [Oculimacula yallundae]|uniref:Uncharacterized protein n=1 Tax=Oculimacula yallundae TaxID=86028 RepID=A0ABR4C165_9HELO